MKEQEGRRRSVEEKGKQTTAKPSQLNGSLNFLVLNLEATENFMISVSNQCNHIKITAGKMLRFKKHNTAHCMLTYNI